MSDGGGLPSARVFASAAQGTDDRTTKTQDLGTGNRYLDDFEEFSEIQSKMGVDLS